MQPIGNKYLVKVSPQPVEEKVGDIIMPQGNFAEMAHYKGTIVAHGTYMTEKEIIPINTKIIFDWKDKEAKTKIGMNGELYYICEPKAILALDEVTE